MREYVIDLLGVETKDRLHERIAEALELPEYYGNNLDALHDMLTEMAETRITFANYLQADIAMTGYMDALRRMCRNASAETPDLVIVFGDDEEDTDDYDYQYTTETE